MGAEEFGGCKTAGNRVIRSTQRFPMSRPARTSAGFLPRRVFARAPNASRITTRELSDALRSASPRAGLRKILVRPSADLQSAAGLRTREGP
jgi:hypothetical protein